MPSDDAEIIVEYKKRWREGQDSSADFFRNARRGFRYYANDQWEKNDISALKEQQRPALTFNQVSPIINAVAGTEITNRFESRFYPRTTSDVAFADMISEVVRYVRQSTDAEHEESAAFMDCVICGIGCTEFYQDYSKKNSGAEGQTIIQRVPVYEVVVDPHSRKANFEDAEWLIRGKWISEREFIRLYGQDKLDEVKASAQAQEIPENIEIHDQTVSNLYQSDYKFYDDKLGKVAVYEYQWLDEEEFYLVEMNGVQITQDLTKKEFDEILDFNGIELAEGGAPIIPSEDIQSFDYETVDRRVYRRTFISGESILENGNSPVDSFTYRFITGFRKEGEGKVQYFGLMDSMIDPQNWSNKMLSQLVHIVATNPKGAILAEDNVFDNPQKARQDWGKPNPLIQTIPGAIKDKKIQIIYGKYPDSIERVMEIAISSLSRVTGLGPYFTSQVEDLRRTASTAVTSIQQRGLVVLSVLFDSLKKYRKMAGELHLEFIYRFMPDGTIFRITNDPTGQNQPMEFKREWIETIKYDIIVDEAPTSTNALTELWNTLIQTDALGTLIEQGLLTMDIVADIMPNVPNSIRQRMKENWAAQQEALAAQQQVGAVQPGQTQEQ